MASWWWTFAVKQQATCHLCGNQIAFMLRFAWQSDERIALCGECVTANGIEPKQSRRYLNQAGWRKRARQGQQQRAIESKSG